jgi:hypothetical protein
VGGPVGHDLPLRLLRLDLLRVRLREPVRQEDQHYRDVVLTMPQRRALSNISSTSARRNQDG